MDDTKYDLELANDEIKELNEFKNKMKEDFDENKKDAKKQVKALKKLIDSSLADLETKIGKKPPQVKQAAPVDEEKLIEKILSKVKTMIPKGGLAATESKSDLGSKRAS